MVRCYRNLGVLAVAAIYILGGGIAALAHGHDRDYCGPDRVPGAPTSRFD